MVELGQPTGSIQPWIEYRGVDGARKAIARGPKNFALPNARVLRIMYHTLYGDTVWQTRRWGVLRFEQAYSGFSQASSRTARPHSRNRMRQAPMNALGSRRLVFLLAVLAGVLECYVLFSAREVPGSNTLLDDYVQSSLRPHDALQKGDSPSRSSKLRLDWSNLTLTSHMAKRIEATMSNCSLPVGTYPLSNQNGLGSHLHVWSAFLCNAMEQGLRVWSPPPFLWNDESVCGSPVSAFDCYFPSAELLCDGDI